MNPHMCAKIWCHLVQPFGSYSRFLNFWPSNPPWVTRGLFLFSPLPFLDESACVCQIWSRSDHRWRRVYAWKDTRTHARTHARTHTHTHTHCYLLYKAAVFFVCLSPPFFSTRPSDRNQIWHTYSAHSGRYGTHSQLKKFDPAHPRGNITSYVTSSNVEYVRHLKTTARRSMTWYYVMLAVCLAT